MKVHDTSDVAPIELYTQKASTAPSVNAPARLEDDHVQLSAAAKALSTQAATRAVAPSATPSTHDLKAIRNDIARGTYKIDHGRIADGIIADAALSGARRSGPSRGN